MPWLYRLVRGILRFWARLTGIRFLGRENVPDSGKLVFCANHSSFFDPFVLAAALPPYVHFMAKSEFFEGWFLKRVLTHLQVVAVHRGEADIIALKSALTYLKKDEPLAIFPEGRRVTTGELGEFKSGGPFIALRGGAQLIPCALIGSPDLFRFWRRRAVIIGKPIVPQTEGEGDAEYYTAQLKQEIQRMLAEYGQKA